MPLFFTHIPKTAGTSFKKGVVFPNVSPGRILKFNGIRTLLKNRRKPFDFLDGHYPYGVHRFGTYSTPIIYATILREPLDRAISHYYFIKQCDTEHYQHPDLEDVKRWDIGGFNTLPKYQNLQTKFTAGLLGMRVSGLVPQTFFGPLLLARAKYNLAKKYHLLGLVERLHDFEELVAKKMGWRSLSLRDHSKVTRSRPSINALNDATRSLILRGNHLDVQLYEFAQKLVAERREQNSLEKH